MPVGSQSSIDEMVAAWYHPRMRRALEDLITPEIVEEHRANPFGQHSDQLQRIQNYLGQFPINGKLIVEYGGEESEWWLSRMTVEDGRASASREAGPFASESEVIHGIFVQRLREVFEIDVDSLTGGSL